MSSGLPTSGISDSSGAIADSRVMGRELAYYESRVGEDWQPEIVHTLMQWIQISAVYLEIMTEATEHYKRTLRKNTIINLVFSTVASTASLSTFNINETNYPTTSLLLKGLFSLFTVILTISTGYIKVFQIQEKLETAIRLKQEWAVFGSKISSEMQLPPGLRKNAIWLIVKMKDNYLDLIKSDMGVSKDIVRNTAIDAGLKERDLRLSQLFTRIINSEMVRLNGDIFDFDDDCDGPDCKEPGGSGFFSAFRSGAKKLGTVVKSEKPERDLQLGVLESRLNILGEQLENVLAMQTSDSIVPGTQSVAAKQLHSTPSQLGSVLQRRTSSSGEAPLARSSSDGAEDSETQHTRRRPTRVSSYIMKPVSPAKVSSAKSTSGPLTLSLSSQAPASGPLNEFTLVPVLSEDDAQRHAALMSELAHAREENLRISQVNRELVEQTQLSSMQQIRCEMCNILDVVYPGQPCGNCGYMAPSADDDMHSTSSVLSRIPENESVGSARTRGSL